jgi:hypothetical protein
MRREWVGAAAAALFGAAVTVALFGFGPLDPRNEGWLWAELGVDPIQSWLGWTSFRRVPWTLPPGANPDYGMELGTAIYFTDSLPLLALPLKALRGVLDLPQYIGPWLLAYGVVQGLVGWRLVGLTTPDPLARTCGAGLLVLQPMLMHRMMVTRRSPASGRCSRRCCWRSPLEAAEGGARRGRRCWP